MAAVRRFVVFQDSCPSASPASTSMPLPLSSIVLRTNSEKENIHPVTGNVPASGPKAPKDKTKALSTKFVVSTDARSKKQKLVLGVVDEVQPEPKKRRSTSTPTSVECGKVKPRALRATGSSRTKRTTRRPQLPSVEEFANEERPDDRAQAAIDSRCVELTVKSLADVSEAYDSEAPSKPSPEEATLPTTTADSEHRDYFTVSLSSSAVLPLTVVSTASTKKTDNDDCPNADNKTFSTDDLHTFSTPERKKIYSAFTFSSPSPASKRLAANANKPVVPDADAIVLFERLTLGTKPLSL